MRKDYYQATEFMHVSYSIQVTRLLIKFNEICEFLDIFILIKIIWNSFEYNIISSFYNSFYINITFNETDFSRCTAIFIILSNERVLTNRNFPLYKLYINLVIMFTYYILHWINNRDTIFRYVTREHSHHTGDSKKRALCRCITVCPLCNNVVANTV